MTTYRKADKTELERAYNEILERYTNTGLKESMEDETTEGDKVAKAANIKSEVDEMEKRGEQVDPKLKQAATAAEDEINDTIKDLTSD